MPALPNPRHELFAQELAKGNTADAAYMTAGYKPDRHHAARLATKGHVKVRVSELLGRAAEKAVIDRSWVIGKLILEHSRASERRQHVPAIRALELLGKECGMFVDRTENLNINHVVSADMPTAEEWAAEQAAVH